MKTELGLGDTTHDSDHATDQTVAASNASSAPLVGASSGAAGDPRRGDSIGRFVVLGVLGQGGMGVVYSAFDPHLDRKVAIKLLAANARTEGAKIRMLREAQAMAKINHPNVIRVHEVGTFEEQIYLAIEFADAGTVRGWLKQKPSQREILDVFSQAGRGLGAAHALGLVHRDFKPDNVLMSKTGAVQVTDFGLVSVANAVTRPPSEPLPSDTSISQELTQTGSIMGTPTYMAPEQFRGEPATARTDQFSFCVALYEALYGMRPFAGASYAELLVSVTTGAVLPAPPDVKVPAWIRRVLLRGLSIDPAKRYASMDELLAALAHDSAKRRKSGLAVVGLGLLAAGGVAFALLGRDTDPCGNGNDRIATMWNPAQRAQLASVFATSGRPNTSSTVARVNELVDDWAGSWKLGYVDACRATQKGEQSAHVLDLRMQCLTDQLADVRTTLEILARGGNDVVDRGLDIVAELPSVGPCSDTGALVQGFAMPNASIRGVVESVYLQIDKAEVDSELGRLKAFGDDSRAAVVAARATHYPRVISRALRTLALYQVSNADPASLETFEEAMQVAGEAGDQTSMLIALTGRLIELTQANRYDAAQELANLADSLAAQAHLAATHRIPLDAAIARLLEKRGKLKEAQARFEQTLAFAQRENHNAEALMLVLSQLGELYQVEGLLSDAARVQEQSVAVAEKVFGKDQPHTADFLSDLGNTYRSLGRRDDAKQLYDRAIAIRIASLGPDHPSIGTSYNSLGSFYSDGGDLITAQQYFEKALSIWEKAYGKDNAEIYPALLNLGQLLQARGDLVGARRLIERARTLLEAAHGPDNPDVATAIWTLGALANAEHHYAEALELDRQALEVYTKLGDVTDTADCMSEQLEPLRELGRLDEAEALTKRVLELEVKAYGADHVNEGKVLETAAKLEMERKNYAGALDDATRSLKILEATEGKDHPDVAAATLAMGRALTALNRVSEAVPFEERAVAIDIASKQLPATIADARFGLAEALVHDPKTKARAITEAKTALVDADDKAAIRTWLRVHH